jgi:hypothetical protein
MNSMSDEKIIGEVIQTYFDCMFESDPAKAHAVFHRSAKITGFNRGELQEMSVEEFAKFVGAQQPSAKDKGEAPVLEVLSVDIAGDTAVARVRDVYLGRRFLDTLSLLKTDEKWQIYNKLFYVEGDA